MNFFDLRGIFLTQIAGSGNVAENGKYEVKAGGKTHPTYSVAGLDKLCLAYMTEQIDPYYTLLDAYRELGTYSYRVGQEWYEQVIGKKAEINSVSAYKKMYADLVSIWNNMKFVFEVDVPEGDNEVEIGSDYLEYIEYQINWGDGTVENTVNDNIQHTYAKNGKYTVTITVNKIKDCQNDAFTSPTEIPFYINVTNVVIKCIYANYWVPFTAVYNGESTAYTATTIKGAVFVNLQKITDGAPTIHYFGDNRLPYFNPIDGVSNYITSSPELVKEVYIQTIGTDFTEAQQEYTALTTLKVAPDDLTTFKTAVTAFNNGNTTATLTVLKGKHQDEAYQWATENGHFASIVKE